MTGLNLPTFARAWHPAISVGPPPTAVAGAPFDREVYTISSSVALAATSPADTTLEWWFGATYGAATYQSTLTPGALSSFTGTWTAPGTAQNGVGYFKGNISGAGPAIVLTIDTANTQTQQNMTLWNKSGVAVVNADGASGRPLITIPRTAVNFAIVTPTSSGSGRRLLYLDSVSSPTFGQYGMDNWVGVKSGSKMAWLSLNQGNGSGVINITNGDGQVNDEYATVVEGPYLNYQGSGYDIARVEFKRKDGATSNGINAYFDFMGDANTETWTLAAGADFNGAAMLIGAVRRVSSIALPFTVVDKLSVWRTGVNKGGYSNTYQFSYKHQMVDSIANIVGGSSGPNIDICVPSTYDKTLGTGELVMSMKAQTDAADTSTNGGLGKTMYQSIMIDDHPNRQGKVFCIVDERPSEGYWNGVMDDGTKNMSDFIPLVLVPWLIKWWGISPLRGKKRIWGWSKSGNGSLKQALKYSTVWGGAGMADAGYSNEYPANNANLSFNSAATYNLHDPKRILSANKVPLQDKARLLSANGFSWNADLAIQEALFTSEGVPFNIYRATWANHSLGPTGTNNGWLVGFLDAFCAMDLS